MTKCLLYKRQFQIYICEGKEIVYSSFIYTYWKLDTVEVIVDTGSSLKSSWYVVREGSDGFLFIFLFQIICF